MRYCLLVSITSILVGCGSTREIDVWVGDPLTRRPYPNVEVKMTYDVWPQWPGWLSWLPSGSPEPADAVTEATGTAVLPVESHRGAMWLSVVGQRYKFEPEYLDKPAVFRNPRLLIRTWPASE